MNSQIFDNSFKILFFTTKNDMWDLWGSFSNDTEEEKDEIREKSNKHLRKTVLLRLKKEKDKKEAKRSDEEIIFATSNLQAVIPAPRADTYIFA